MLSTPTKVPVNMFLFLANGQFAWFLTENCVKLAFDLVFFHDLCCNQNNNRLQLTTRQTSIEALATPRAQHFYKSIPRILRY